MAAIIRTRKEFKKIARKTLFSDYRTVLFSTLLFTAVSFGFFMISKSYCTVVTLGLKNEIRNMVSLTFDIFSLLLLYPFFMGYISVFCKMTAGENVSAAELMRYYSSKKELKSCFTFLIAKIPELFAKLILPFILLYASYIFLPGVLSYMVEHGYEAFAIAFSNYFFIIELAVITLVLYFMGGLLLSVLDFCKGTKTKYTFKDKRRFFALRLSLIPLYLLSVLSFGILYITYTLPFTITVYSMFSKAKTEKNQLQSKTKEFSVPIFNSPLNAEKITNQ